MLCKWRTFHFTYPSLFAFTSIAWRKCLYDYHVHADHWGKVWKPRERRLNTRCPEWVVFKGGGRRRSWIIVSIILQRHNKKSRVPLSTKATIALCFSLEGYIFGMALIVQSKIATVTTPHPSRRHSSPLYEDTKWLPIVAMSAWAWLYYMTTDLFRPSKW